MLMALAGDSNDSDLLDDVETAPTPLPPSPPPVPAVVAPGAERVAPTPLSVMRARIDAELAGLAVPPPPRVLSVYGFDDPNDEHYGEA
jgi:hypothetical protein